MDLLTTSACALRQKLAEGSLSAEALMEATLVRIEEANPRLNAVVSMAEQDAVMEAARACDRLPEPARGPLHGLPVAIKDLADAEGLRSTQGSPLFADQVAQHDSLFVARMRAAGAIIIGKTNTPEFGLGSHTFNPVHGATGNIYDPTRSAGGSSGGAAVALAAGMVALADGSDMMGSLRNPAGWNGVYGLRPTWGRVPDPDGDPFLHPLSTNGPMGRTPDDVALLLSVMEGADPRAPLSAIPSSTSRSPAKRGGRALRLGWLGDWGGAYPMDAGLLETTVRAHGIFGALGHEVVALDPPFPAEKIWQAWTVLRSFAIAGGLGALASRREALKPEAIWELDRGLALRAAEILEASQLRAQWMRRAAALFDEVDMLLLPSAQVWPFDINVRYPETIAGRGMDSYHRWMEIVTPASLIGLPALGLPAGFGSAAGPDGAGGARLLPAGLQLIGPHGSDAALLDLGQRYHEASASLRAAPATLG